MTTVCLRALAAGAILCAALLPASGSGVHTQPATSDALAEFEQRVASYLALRERLERALEPLRPLARPGELMERQNALAAAVRRARLESGPARLIPDPAVAHLRGILRAFFADQPATRAEQAIDLLPSGHPPIVNARYPSFVPVSTIPPQLISRLPALPDNLQYRFHGDYLIVLDGDLSLVLDTIPDALPPYVGDHPAAPAAEPRLLGAAAAPPPADVVRFAVIGDSGTGGRAQRLIAEQLIAARARFPYAFVLMLGDNLYGDEDPDDYVEKFEEPYAPLLAAGVTFYAALGNHDEPAQIFYAPFNMGGRRYYTLRKGPAEFFVLDSTYMSPGQLLWIRRALAASDADWKIAMMHHPLYSTGRRHGGSEELRDVLEPIFVAHGVDLVLAGHEHFYERLRPQRGIYYVTSGAAARLREGNVQGGRQTAEFFDEGYSFVLMQIQPDALLFEAISADGRIVDSGRLPRRQ